MGTKETKKIKGAAPLKNTAQRRIKRSVLLLAGASLATVLTFSKAALAQETTRTIRQLSPTDIQEEVLLSADEVSYNYQQQSANARGNAVLHYGQRVLSAEEIRYDQGVETVHAIGNLTVLNEDGTVLLADDATLTQGLESGQINAPAIILPDGSRIAARQGRRAEGRFSALSKAVFSPCEICSAFGYPLWQIRAREIVHDEQEKLIHYRNAMFDVLGLPVLYLPYLRQADPTVRRKTGLLSPRFRLSKTLGYTIKTPLFVTLGPYRDLTLTPFLTSNDGLIMEAEYRANTLSGGYRIGGSITYNDELDGREHVRWGLDGEGRFSLGDNREWGFDLNLASDDSYLARYNYSASARAVSHLYVRHIDNQTFAEANGYYLQSFRTNEPIRSVPIVAPELRLRTHLVESPDYGFVTADSHALVLRRRGDETSVVGKLDPATGRDVMRLSGGLSWERPTVFSFGLEATPFAFARGNAYYVQDDAQSDKPNHTEFRLDSAAGVDLRYPLIRQGETSQQILEPIVQFVLSPERANNQIPNEDSLDFEFDESNALAAGRRFSGYDRFETGSHMNLGLRYAFEHDSGIGIDASYGRVFRLKEQPVFSTSSGLRELNSDHVGAISLKFPPYFEITQRLRLDSQNGDINRQEIYAQASYDRVSLRGSYTALAADSANAASQDRKELNLSGRLKVSEHWTIYGSARRDLEANSFVNTGGGLRYEDECLLVDLSATRRFSRRGDARDNTDFALQFQLKGLGM